MVGWGGRAGGGGLLGPQGEYRAKEKSEEWSLNEFIMHHRLPLLVAARPHRPCNL